MSIKSIIVVGSSGAGKTTLVNGLRGPAYADKLCIPKRYITRPERQGDDLTENAHIDQASFAAKVADSSIGLHWSRPLDGGRVEQYGFETVKAGVLALYSANNAILRDPDPSVKVVLSQALVVLVMSSSDARTARLGERSPDMSAAERAVRLSDAGLDILDTDVELKIIETTSLSDEEGQAALQSIVNDVLTGTNQETAVFKGKIGEVIHTTQPDGRIFERYRRPPGVRLVIVTPDKKLLMTRERRQETGGVDLRLPGGKVRDSLKDYHQLLASSQDMMAAAAEAAIKEASEEVGIAAKNLKPLVTAPAGATVEWDLYYFITNDYQENPDGQQLEHGEDIKLAELSPAEVRQAITAGQMQEWRSVGVLLGLVLPQLESS